MPWQPQIVGARHMVSAGHHLAALAGFEILEAGGNAIDAGVAAGLALGVVHSDQVQVSGVAPILIHLAESGETLSIAGLGPWPRATRPEHFIDELGGTIPLGLLRTVVPAAPDAWILALARHGTMAFSEVAEAAIRHARDGFAMHPFMASFIRRNEANYARWPSSAAIYLPQGRPPAEGELFRQGDLAASLQYMADEDRAASARGGRAAGLAAARDAFYRGDLARAMVAYHAENGGWLTAEDLADYRSEIEVPPRRRFAEWEVVSCGAWCQGPALLQMLAMLDGEDLAALGHNTADYIHLLVEVMKLALADREAYYGDPRQVEVPLETLLSESYAEARRAEVAADRAAVEMPAPGRIDGATPGTLAILEAAAEPASASADTSFACAVDKMGNVFSATPSDVSFESPVIPGLGFCPSARGSQSFAIRGHASAVAPGKRPRLTPNPAIAFRGEAVRMPFGTPGGDAQTQAMLQVFVNIAVFAVAPQEAVEAPRFVTHGFPGSFEPHVYRPGRLEIEDRIDERVRAELASRGHGVVVEPALSDRVGGVCLIEAERESGRLWGGADPRRPARAIGR